MVRVMRNRVFVFLSLGAAVACSVSGGAQLNVKNSGSQGNFVRDVDPDDLDKGGPATGVPNLRYQKEVCQGLDLRPSYSHLSADNFLEQLKTANLEYTVEQARTDLIYVDVKTGEKSSRFRVATLSSAVEAGRHLHEAILQHGPGSWGIQRSNLAVLGPIGSEDDVVSFAATTKLCCWGTLMVAGRDDAFVVPGGYLQP
jgi:hypothetical protein